MLKESCVLEEISSSLDTSIPHISIILAAGHGKRLRSHLPKMLYEIWGVPTVVRVSRAVREGFATPNEIVVVGIKWKEVAHTLGKSPHRVFVFQKEQKGTGDAVKIALRAIPEDFTGNIYILPGDMGLIDARILQEFREAFEKSASQMFILTGEYEGDPGKNYYGRVVKKEGEVLGIVEYRDILSLSKPLTIGNHTFTARELLNIREFNAGVYAFDHAQLRESIRKIKPDNVQKEYYLTDLVKIFRLQGLRVGARKVKNSSFLLGFNDRIVLKQMNNIARKNVYDKLKQIVTFEDPDDFFIAEEVVEKIMEMGGKEPVDITIGQGAYIGRGVKLSPQVVIGKNVRLEGNVTLQEKVKIGDEVRMSSFAHQEIRIGRNTEIFWGDVIKGNVTIGENCRIESWVRITGSDEYPVKIGRKVLIKGNSYIFGCVIESEAEIEHSVLNRKKIKSLRDGKGNVKRIKYVLPPPEGEEAMEDLP